MRSRSLFASLLFASLLLAAGCGPSPLHVPQDPPPRAASQTSDRPPTAFLSDDLVIRDGSKHRPWCFGLDELLDWLGSQAVTDQRWTLLDAGRWRLDGFAYGGREHTVWVFEQFDDGVELVGYRDSDIADRTPKGMMEIYYPWMSNYHTDLTRKRYGSCENPYE